MKNKSSHKNIPNALRSHRLERGLTQQDMAKLLNLKDNTLISRWETGIAYPNAENIMKLCKIYRTTFERLFGNIIITIDVECQQ